MTHSIIYSKTTLSYTNLLQSTCTYKVYNVRYTPYVSGASTTVLQVCKVEKSGNGLHETRKDLRVALEAVVLCQYVWTQQPFYQPPIYLYLLSLF